MSGGHTPGPWAVSKQKARRVTANGVIICNAVLRNQGGPKHKSFLKDEHEAEANACLIAAAPELLALLERFADDYPPSSIGREWIDTVIAKARGVA